MKLLLDTHTFLWWDRFPENLPQGVLDLCKNKQHELYLSVASLWEMQIKQNLGKLSLHQSLSNILLDQVQRNDLKILPIQVEHILALSRLTHAHKDPFDRMLITQANVEKMTLLSADSVFKHYDVDVFWQ
jgi:PIN domain nuclease of toxin-antitoxin system